MADAFTARTAAELVDQVDGAIEVAELTAQHAPGGHPVFAALENAREVRDWLNDNGALMASGIGTNVRTYVQGALDRLYEAAGDVRNDPSAPPPLAIWPQARSLPWPWIAAGAGGILLVAILFQKRARAR